MRKLTLTKNGTISKDFIMEHLNNKSDSDDFEMIEDAWRCNNNVCKRKKLGYNLYVNR